MYEVEKRVYIIYYNTNVEKKEKMIVESDLVIEFVV